MALNIVYIPEAEETLTSVYDFIKNRFGTRSAETLLNKAEKIIRLISEHPEMYKAVPFDNSVRKGLITKQTSVFYRINNETIELLFFWDNRQDELF